MTSLLLIIFSILKADAEQEKKIHVEIKPISNGNAPLSPSVDELRATIEGISLSPVSFPTVSTD